MKEDKYIETLFEAARKEPPQLSFGEVAERFASILSPSSPFDMISNFFKQINLNSILMFTLVSIITTLFFVNHSIDLPQNEALLTENLTPIENLTIAEDVPDKKVAISQFSRNKITPTVVIEEASNLLAQNLVEINTTDLDDLPGTRIALLPLAPLKAPNLTFLSFEKDTVPVIKTISSKRLTKDEGIESAIFTRLDLNKRHRNYSTSTNIKNPKLWKTYTNNFNQEFDLQANGWTEIINEWGKVELKTWEQNKVKIDVLVTLKTDRPKKAEEVLANIEVKFNNDRSKVRAETIINKRKAISWNNRKNWEVQIDYLVYLPTNSNLKVYNYGGKVSLEKLNGAAQFDLNFSDLEVGEMGNDSKVLMRNAKGTIGKSGDLISKLHFSEIVAEEVGNLELEANNSSFEAQKGKDIKTSSQYGTLKFGAIGDYSTKTTGGKLEIGTAGKLILNLNNVNVNLRDAGDLEADFTFTDFNAKSLGELDLKLRNSDVEAKTVKNVKNDSQWGSVKLGSVQRYENSSTGTKIELGTAQEVKVKSQNSKLTIEELSGNLDLDMTFGGCKATLTNPKPNITLHGKNADFDFNLPSAAQFQIDLTSNTKNFKFPGQIKAISQIDKIGHQKFQGYLGNQNAENMINAELSFGNLKMRVE